MNSIPINEMWYNKGMIFLNSKTTWLASTLSPKFGEKYSAAIHLCDGRTIIKSAEINTD